MKLIEYYRVLKELKLIQVAYRAKYIIKRKLVEQFSKSITLYYYKKSIKKGITTACNKEQFLINKRSYYKYNLNEVFEYSFTFLNEKIQFNNQIEWNHGKLNHGTRLWKLNLHYHEWLIDVVDLYLRTKEEKYLIYFCDAINDWIKQNPIGTKDYGKDNWNSYCISLRLVAWIKIYSKIEQDLSEEFKERFLRSVRMQVDFLVDNLELDILGNHLIKNWKALIWAGYFFDENKYLKKAEKIEKNYILTQFTKDGLHEEMSPMYTGIVLEDLLEVYSLNRKELLREQIIKSAEALAPLVNENEYLLFNDSVNNNEVSVKDLNILLKTIVGKGLFIEGTFNVSGYVGLKQHDMHLVFDTASAISSPQPGHLICDQLSFELFVKNRKIFTNSGVYEYNNGARRKYARSTESHNTLKIGELNQSEVVGSFRVMRRSKTESNILSLKRNRIIIKGKVDGFDFKGTYHEREINYTNNTLIIEDYYNSPMQYSASIYFHLHPDITPLKFVSGYKLLYQDVLIAEMLMENLETELTKTDFYPEFGKKLKKHTIIIHNSLPNVKSICKILIYEKDIPYI